MLFLMNLVKVQKLIDSKSQAYAVSNESSQGSEVN